MTRLFLHLITEAIDVCFSIIHSPNSTVLQSQIKVHVSKAKEKNTKALTWECCGIFQATGVNRGIKITCNLKTNEEVTVKELFFSRRYRFPWICWVFVCLFVCLFVWLVGWLVFVFLHLQSFKLSKASYSVCLHLSEPIVS